MPGCPILRGFLAKGGIPLLSIGVRPAGPERSTSAKTRRFQGTAHSGPHWPIVPSLQERAAEVGSTLSSLPMAPACNHQPPAG
jgi:hypothetical protein